MDIYKATNKINGDSYIGYAVNELKRRKPRHETLAKNGNGFYFHNAIRRYGWDNFSWVLLEHGITDFDQLQELEIYWIEQFDTYYNGYNLTKGGGGIFGYHHKEETRRKIGEASKSRKHTEESIKKISEANKGKKHSEETRRKLSEANKGQIPCNKGIPRSEETKRKISEAKKGRIPWNKGKTDCYSEDVKRKMSKGHKGKKLSDETRRKISESEKGKKVSEETRRKMSESHKSKKHIKL